MYDQQLLPTMFVLSTSTTTQTSPKYLTYLKTIQELLPVDFTLLIFLILIILGFMGYGIYRCLIFTKYRTTLTLEIMNNKNSFKWTVAHLSYTPSFYRFNINTTLTNIRMYQTFFRCYLEWTAGLTI